MCIVYSSTVLARVQLDDRERGIWRKWCLPKQLCRRNGGGTQSLRGSGNDSANCHQITIIYRVTL